MNPDGSGDGPAPGYAPPRWLRSPHLQTVLGTSPWRRRRGAEAPAAVGATPSEHLVDGGEGIRLHGLYSEVPGTESRGLVLLLHGWEGSAESSYMRLTAAQLLARGFDVFRLNFRDHGGTHHLNPDIFHSCRIEEVLHAAGDIAHRFARRPMRVAGYSLGGNFALRLALRAPEAGLELAHVAAVCPVLDPARTMRKMEDGLWFYMRYFERKWRGSLARKRALFPDRHDFDDTTLRLGMRELTEWLVQRHTDFGTIDNYFDGYSVAGGRLSRLRVPADILMAAGDPGVPMDQFRYLAEALAAQARGDIVPWGGQCGFLENGRFEGFAERWIATRLAADGTDVTNAH